MSKPRILRTYLVRVHQVWEYDEPTDLHDIYPGSDLPATERYDLTDLDEHVCDTGRILADWIEVVDDDDLSLESAEGVTWPASAEQESLTVI